MKRVGRGLMTWLAVLGVAGPALAEELPPSCPEGATRVGTPPPEGQETWCVRPDALGTPVRHGPWMRWRADGTPLELSTFRDGILHGRVARWYPDGQLASEGEYRFGRAEGVHRRFDPSGDKASEERYAEGALEGWVVAWHPHGVKASEVRYRANRPHGPASRWFPDGGPRSEGEYRDGLRHGTWRYWYRRGALDLVGEYALGERQGNWVRRWPSGRKWWEGAFRRGRPHGPFTWWHEDGRVAATGAFSDGLRSGTWRFPRGEDEEPETVTFQGGRPLSGDLDSLASRVEVTPGLAPGATPEQVVALARKRLPLLGFRPNPPPEPRVVRVSADVPSDADGEGFESWSVPRSFAGVVWRVEFEGRFARRVLRGLGAPLLPDARDAVVEISDAQAAKAARAAGAPSGAGRPAPAAP